MPSGPISKMPCAAVKYPLKMPAKTVAVVIAAILVGLSQKASGHGSNMAEDRAARFTFLHYAKGKTSGVEFNSDDPPAFRDVLSFSYHNLGMTYQGSNTSVSDREIRSVALRHCLLFYVFGAISTYRPISRPMRSFMISVVPPKIVWMRESV